MTGNRTVSSLLVSQNDVAESKYVCGDWWARLLRWTDGAIRDEGKMECRWSGGGRDGANYGLSNK